MRTHKDEVHLARLYTATFQASYLTDEQLRSVVSRGRELHRWFRNHLSVHYLINGAVLVSLVVTALASMLIVPRLFLAIGQANPISHILAASLIAGLMHGWVGYSFSAFTIHEGAAHKLIFPPRGGVTSLLNSIANQLPRLSGADPAYYAESHLAHHSKFGTEEDAEFLNFVKPQRFYRSLVPFGFLFGGGDFFAHRPVQLTRSSFLSLAVLFAYGGSIMVLSARLFGILFAVLAVFVFATNFGSMFDRIRQFSEHNLMPLENRSGARSFGLGLWGFIVGGGPWGQPCHLIHHLVPTLPWYQQVRLHYFMVSLISKDQRKRITANGIVQFPVLVGQLVSRLTRFMAAQEPTVPVEELATAD